MIHKSIHMTMKQQISSNSIPIIFYLFKIANAYSLLSIFPFSCKNLNIISLKIAIITIFHLLSTSNF